MVQADEGRRESDRRGAETGLRRHPHVPPFSDRGWPVVGLTPSPTRTTRYTERFVVSLGSLRARCDVLVAEGKLPTEFADLRVLQPRRQ